jgi:hypothetical protein
VLARRNGQVLWLTGPEPPKLAAGDRVLSFGPTQD